MNTTKRLVKWKGKLARSFLGKRSRSRRRAPRAEPPPDGVTALLQASRAAMDVLAEDCTAFVEGAARQTERFVKDALHKNSTGRVWLPSFVGLGATDLALSTKAFAGSTRGLAVVGAAGGLGLMAASTLDLWRAHTPEEFLDASGDLAWGVQGLSYLTAGPTAATLTTGLGFVGAVVQISAGVLRITRGVKLRDSHAVKLGSLDVGGGILWAALDVAAWGNPLVLGSYVVLMIGREAYANKDALRRSWLMRPRLVQGLSTDKAIA